MEKVYSSLYKKHKGVEYSITFLNTHLKAFINLRTTVFTFY